MHTYMHSTYMCTPRVDTHTVCTWIHASIHMYTMHTHVHHTRAPCTHMPVSTHALTSIHTFILAHMPDSTLTHQHAHVYHIHTQTMAPRTPHTHMHTVGAARAGRARAQKPAAGPSPGLHRGGPGPQPAVTERDSSPRTVSGSESGQGESPRRRGLLKQVSGPLRPG